MWGPFSQDAICLSCSASNTDTSLFIPVGQHLSERQNRHPSTEGALKLSGSLQSVNAYPGEFFGPLCWIMTEWERSHRDKGEGGRGRGQEKETDEGGGKRGGFELILSLSLCDGCHRGSAGLWFNTMADNNRADGQMAMYVPKDFCVSVCVHLHA